MYAQVHALERSACECICILKNKYMHTQWKVKHKIPTKCTHICTCMSLYAHVCHYMHMYVTEFSMCVSTNTKFAPYVQAALKYMGRCTAIPIIIEGHFQVFKRFTSIKLVQKQFKSRFAALSYSGNGSTYKCPSSTWTDAWH
jgi:hypothetical protein